MGEAMRKPFIISAAAGCLAALTYITYTVASNASQDQRLTQKQAVHQLLSELKSELRKEHNFQPTRDDGLFSKDFFVKLHYIIYKYKKYGIEMLAEANFQERIRYLEECEEFKEEAKTATGESANSLMKQAADLSKKYQEVMRGE